MDKELRELCKLIRSLDETDAIQFLKENYPADSDKAYIAIKSLIPHRSWKKQSQKHLINYYCENGCIRFIFPMMKIMSIKNFIRDVKPYLPEEYSYLQLWHYDFGSYLFLDENVDEQNPHIQKFLTELKARIYELYPHKDALGTLNVRFGEIEHGWLPITISGPEFDFVIDAADMPIDPINSFIELADFLISLEGDEHISEFYLEPESCLIIAKKHEYFDTADFKVSCQKVKFSVNGLSCFLAAKQLHNAIRQIEPQVNKALINEQWSWEFPSEALDSLSNQIKIHE